MRRLLVVLGVMLGSGSGIVPVPDALGAQPESIEFAIKVEAEGFGIESCGGYEYVVGGEVVYPCEAGLPALPMKVYHVAIPSDARPVAIEARCTRQRSLGRHLIAPTQPPAILGGPAKPWVNGREDIYSLATFYPADIMGGFHVGYMGEIKIVSFYLTPFRWNPATRELRLCEEIEISISLVHDGSRRSLGRRARPAPTFRRMLKRMVLNPDDVATFTPRQFEGEHISQLSPDTYDYVIVTCDSLASAFAPLVEWKTSKGVRATCVTREWIEGNYPGEDIQAQIRNFIRDAYETWGTLSVLLGGDTKIIPSRTVYAMDCEMGGIAGNRIRCDLYFGDLDGSWNANGVNPYGEVADSVDMYPDVFVGRAPAENVADAQVFVNKVITYEKNPPSGYALDMLLAGEIMWLDPYTDGGAGLDMIDENYIPPRFDPILKLYESLGNESRESVLAAMSAGQNFIFHDGHCSEYAMGAGDGYIYTDDADTVSNGARTFILNSIGCWPAAIDRDCIAEHFLNNPNGGCVAFIGNSRYGWGSPGNPGLGYSDKFQHEFAKKVFVDSLLHIGEAHALSKAVFVGFAQDENVYRWNEYQLNLLGDPEMPMWTDEPSIMSVSAPESVMASGQMVTVVAEDPEGPVENALVCISNGSDVYEVGRTDLAGKVSFWISTASTDSLVFTVSSFNHRPCQGSVRVVSEGVVLDWTDLAIADGGDSLANPGETVDLRVKVKNFGSEAASGVTGKLRGGSHCTILDSLIDYGTIAAGEEVWPDDFFRVAFDSNPTNGETITFDLILEDSASNTWTRKFPVRVATPVFYLASYGIDDRWGGDGDYVVEPGEEVLVTLEIANRGLTSGSCQIELASLDPFYTVIDTSSSLGEIASNDAGYGSHRIEISGTCPAQHMGPIALSLTCGPYAFTDTLYLAVGDLTYIDDFESGEGMWSHSGSPDAWHLTSSRSHSDSMSWYFGSEATHLYPANANGSLISQDFIAGESNRFSFWFWYDFTTYGTDGIYVIVHRNGVPDTLDFIGSGGALGSGDAGALNIVSRWVKWERPLDVVPGDTLRFEFAFISDDTDEAEGIYIDAIAFTCHEPVRTGIDTPEIGDIVAFTVLPNPATSGLRIRFARSSGELKVAIYSIDGRLVSSLGSATGKTTLGWDLRDRSGRRVAPGIYLVRVAKGRYASSRKIVVMR